MLYASLHAIRKKKTKAFESYALMARARGEEAVYKEYLDKAHQLKIFFNEKWGIKEGELNYVRGYDINHTAYTNWDSENSWFIPMKKLSDANEKTEHYLNFIDSCVSTKENRPSNIESISYLPETFFRNNRNTQGWKWLEYLIDHLEDEHVVKMAGKNENYPEISYVVISNVVEGLMGIVPNSATNSFSTRSCLPSEIQYLTVKNIRVGSTTLDITHNGSKSSSVDYIHGTKPLTWEIEFAGQYSQISVNGKDYPAKQKVMDGITISYLEQNIEAGKKYKATAK